MKILSNKIYCSLIIILISACNKEQENPSPINLSDDYSFCNSQLSDCNGGNGDYCLFGFKWGPDSIFQQAGFNSQGPKSSGGMISYSFQEENGLINTHRQINLASKSFEEILSCAKAQIRNALDSWSEMADLKFEEISENGESDIRFYVADIIQSGIGYPNYADNLCQDLAGNVIIQAGLGIDDCDLFYSFALHEIGHVLGLGHVNSANVMNPDFLDFNFQELQAGDSLGIIEIYGEY